MINFRDKVNFIWSVADLLRGDYKQADYGKVILPMTVLRRLDCVLEPTKEQVLTKAKQMEGGPVTNLQPILERITGHPFYNTSRLTFQALLGDPAQIAANLKAYIYGFSERAREAIDRFRFEEQIAHLDRSNLLYKVVQRFAAIDLHPDVVSNHEMGYIFEELIRRFSEQSNETAGEHFTPREVIRLMVNLLFNEDREVLTRPGIIRTLYDPACGTGGMLSVAEEYLLELNPDGRLEVFGQELNPESFAICNSDMMMKGQNPDNIKFGNSFTQDGLAGETFDYMLSNPPFGVEWKKVQEQVEDEHKKKGYAGRFGAGLPRINDGSFLFLQHMIRKMKPGGSRIGIVFNGSPLFTGLADSGESRIRRWIIENDWLEAIVALPMELYYNTGIATYVWIVTNRKSPRRKGKVQLVNAVGFFRKMRKSLGNKRNFMPDEQIAEITRIYGNFTEGEDCKIFNNEDFGYRRITVERPLRLSFQVSDEHIERLRDERAFVALAESKKRDLVEREREEEEGRLRQEQILSVLQGIDSDMIYRSRPEFEKVLSRAFREAGVALPAPLKKAILSALSERDETSEVCLDARGNPEPDPELRDYENVPLKEDVHAYFEREVLPHVPDAWIDESKTKIGYEIPFTRHFFKSQELRPLEEIDAEIRALEAEIQEMLTIMWRDEPPHSCALAGVGAIPEHWETKKLKYIASVTFSNVDKKTVEGEYPVRLCNYVNVYYNDRITPELDFMRATASSAEIANFALRKGDVLVTKDSESSDDIAVPAYVIDDFDDVLCGYHLALVRPRSTIVDGRFLFYCFAAERINRQFQIAANGITRYGLTMDGLGSALFPVPPLDEQHAIADWLDRRSAATDAIIHKKERLIELLQEERQALISHAVTRGLLSDGAS